MSKIKALVEGVTHDLIAYLMDDSRISIEQAMESVYNSALFDKLSDPETGLYRESSAYVYTLLKDELEYGRIIQTEV